MKRIIFFLFWLLLIFHCVHAQGPRLSLTGATGPWRGWLDYQDGYGHTTRMWQPFASIALGADFGRGSKIAFATSLGLEYYGMTYDYLNDKSLSEVHSKLSMLYTKLGFGIKLKPSSKLMIGLGIDVLLASGTSGTYQVANFIPYQGIVVTGDYRDHFERIRKIGNWGPAVSISYLFPLKNGAAFGPSVGAFMSQEKIFQRDFSTQLNPKIARLNLALVYTFAANKPNTEK